MRPVKVKKFIVGYEMLKWTCEMPGTPQLDFLSELRFSGSPLSEKH